MLKPNVQSFAERIGEWAAQPDLGVDAEVRKSARMSLIDTLACTVIGTHERQAVAAMEAMRFGLHSGSVTPVGGGKKLSLHGAALVNGVRTHAIDFDDYELSGSSHASAPILSALFALAQVTPLTIDEVCDAWVVGYEVVIWMGMALGYGHYDIGWHSTSTLGPIAAAAACAKALRLSDTQIANAMALAASSSAGLKMQFGFDAKAIHAGLSAESGLRAALLARGNATGNCNLWDSEFGFTKVYGTADSIGFKEMMRSMNLGRAVNQFPVVRKLWPSCAYTHRPIHAAERLHERMKPDDRIASIKVRMPEPFHRVAGFIVPTNDAEARFSVSYCAVVGLLTGHVTPEDFRETRFTDPLRQRMTAEVELDLYKLPKGDPGDIGPSNPETITVTLADGRVIAEETGHVPGGVAIPMTQDQLMRKVADCRCSVEMATAFLKADGARPIDETGILNQAWKRCSE